MSSELTLDMVKKVMFQLGYTLMMDTPDGSGLCSFIDERAPGQIVSFDFSRGTISRMDFMETLRIEGVDPDAVSALLD